MNKLRGELISHFRALKESLSHSTLILETIRIEKDKRKLQKS